VKKKKIEAFWFYEDTYKTNFLFFIGSEEDLFRYVKRKYGFPLDHLSGKQSEGSCYNIGGYGFVIHLPEFELNAKQLACLMHEVNHAAIDTFERINSKIIDETSEPFCYYTESLVRKFLELYLKK